MYQRKKTSNIQSPPLSSSTTKGNTKEVEYQKQNDVTTVTNTITDDNGNDEEIATVMIKKQHRRHRRRRRKTSSFFTGVSGAELVLVLLTNIMMGLIVSTYYVISNQCPPTTTTTITTTKTMKRIEEKEEKCVYRPDTKIIKENENEDVYPSNFELFQCKEKVNIHWQFNHLPSSPAKYQKYHRHYPTFNFDALINSTMCAAIYDRPTSTTNNNNSNKTTKEEEEEEKKSGPCYKNRYMTGIHRIPTPRSSHEFEPYALRAIPTIFTSYADRLHQSHSNLWGIANSTKILSSSEHAIRIRHHSFDDVPNQKLHSQMTLSRYLQVILDKTLPSDLPMEALLLGNSKSSDPLISYLGYQPPPYYLPDDNTTTTTTTTSTDDYYRYPHLLIENNEMTTPLHKDGPDLFVILLRGTTRRYTVFPPEDLHVLNCTFCDDADSYVDLNGRGEGGGGHLYNGYCACPKLVGGIIGADNDEEEEQQQRLLRNKEQQQEQQFLNLPQESQPFTFDLHQGEVLYIPGGWFYTARNINHDENDVTIFINQFMKHHIGPRSVWGKDLIRFWARGNYRPMK